MLGGEPERGAPPLDELAFQLAESHVVFRRPPTPVPSLLKRVREWKSLLREAHEHFRQMSDAQRALSYTAEWLLDNFYVIQQALRQVREDMPARYYRELPKLGTSPLKGYPRVYALAQAVIGYCAGRLDLDRVVQFVHAYQKSAPLTMGELWALPTMLRLGSLERLARTVARVIGQPRPDDERISPAGLTDDAIVASCILNLRMLATQDWNTFFEGVSRVEQILRRDPAGVYERMDFDTRDRYRGIVEKLSQGTGQDEEKVAWEAIRLAQSAGKERAGESVSPRTLHVGFYLVGAGRAQLEACLGYRPPWGDRWQRWLLGHPTLAYLGAITLITLAILGGLLGYAVVAGGTLVQWVGTGLLALLPASAVAVSLVNRLVSHIVPPRVLPKMDFQEGVPVEYSTMVVVPALLTGAEEVRSLLQQLEQHFLRNEDPQLYFALLTDFADAPQEHMPDDARLLEQIEAGIRDLNRKYGRRGVGPFYLFHRGREWNPAEDCWMGWERKRGKLVELNRLLLGDGETSYTVQIGRMDVLGRIKYVITLDADTILPRDGARQLIATMAHPLNRAEFASAPPSIPSKGGEGGAVVAGYTVLQPRVEIKPASAGRSLFTRVYAGDTGLDLYTLAVSDVYQDLFGEGIYAGKGIYDVAAFERSLAGRVPDNALLSHDLFEGIHGRVGLVTDVVLYEDYPAHYLAYAHRSHRWVRGDWQLLPWLLPGVPLADGGNMPSDFSTLDRWKLLDNLRRSLLTPALLAFLIAGWIWLPGSAWVWTLVGVLVLTVPASTGIVTAFMQGLQRGSLAGVMQLLGIDALRWLFALTFLPYEALIKLDAILSTLVRLTITRKRLLQWTTAAHTVRLFGRKARLGLMWRKMWLVPLSGLALTYLIVAINRVAFPAALLLLFVWVESPQIAYWISQPVVRKQATLSAEQRRQLRRLARRTWLYFEQFVGPEDHWLPPDHFQEDPRGLVAHRTSPTNIGLLLLSTLAAYDLGYIGPMDLALRLRLTFEGLSRLARPRGHFLNWYDTRDLTPLPPRYISTVDSGNLAACLLVLERGLRESIHTPVLRWQQWQGVLDTVDVLAKVVSELEDEVPRTAIVPVQDHLNHVSRRILATRDSPDDWAALLAWLEEESWPELERLLVSLVASDSHTLDTAVLRELRIWSAKVRHQIFSVQPELDLLLPWLSLLSRPPDLTGFPEPVTSAWQELVDALPITPELDDVAGVCRAGQARLERLRNLLTDESGPAGQVEEVRAWCKRLSEGLDSARMTAEGLVLGYQDLSTEAESYFQGMNFDFLFNPLRRVFHIGYNVENETLDNNYYDLLASEARIASLLAIARDDVPQSHWLHLARPITQVDGARALLSWGGTMFEYLMPLLLMHNYDETLLGQSCRAAVDHQIAYGRRKGTPWGISESGYYRFDANMNYQYRGFGVPGLGFRRDLADDLVVSPYASLLALPLRPQAVMRNIAHLIELQMLGCYGFYEAIDYTDSRLPPGQKSAIVRSYMVHHHGMSLLALTNYFEDQVMVRRFHADPRIQSVQLLLQEQIPHLAPVEYPHPEEVRPVRWAQPPLAVAPWSAPVEVPAPQVHVLSNGRYSLLVTSAGGGYSDWQGIALTRWRADTTLDNWGTWIYVQDRDSGALWSAGYQPTCTPPAGRGVSWYAYQARFWRRDRDLCVRTEITVSPDDDVEIRRVTLTNHSDRPRRLTLTSYGEVVLAPQAADRRHTAFNKLFVESEYLPELNGLLFRRRPRSAEEAPIYMAHLLVVEPGQEITGAHEGDRARFLGRGRTVRAPAALSPPMGGDEGGGGLSGTVGSTLDPIMALGQEIDLEPHAKTEIAYITLAARSRPEALDLARRYQEWPAINWAFDQARSHSEMELRQLGLTTSEVASFQQLLSSLLYPHAALRADPATLAANSKGQSGLWAFAISGDYPILLARIAGEEGIELVRELLQAHAYWRNRRIQVDLVILNERGTSYDQELQGQLFRLIARMDGDNWLNRRGGIFVLRADQMGRADRILLEASARAVLDGDKGSLVEQLSILRKRPTHLPPFVSTLSLPLSSSQIQEETEGGLARPADLIFDNGLGGFSADGREYVIFLQPDQRTPAPWINVIANRDFGFLVSEAGLGFTWAENSGENRLTPWRNDPVADPPSEALYLRDEEVGHVWSPTPLPAGARVPFLIRHGAGYSIFENHSHGLRQRLRLFVVPNAPVKVVHLRLENREKRNRRITATFYAEWVLGPDRDVHQQHVVSEFDAFHNVLLARNPYNEEFGGRVAFLAASREPHGLTADRNEFLGREGSLHHPAALRRVGLASKVGAGLDPCAVYQVHVWLAPGETEDVFFLLGQGEDREDALRLVEQYQDPERIASSWEAVHELWDEQLGAVAVQTPDPAMDLLLNRWLLYQALACRVWGRSALYQSSGAFGFRDQLQDVTALLYAAPEVAREHILRAARYQFEAGDVLHWWHPPSGRGVRTRCSDDLLWLPFVTAHYVDVTGDETILREEVPFLRGDPLEDEETERYGHYEATTETHTLYEHCRRAVKKGMTTGPHGLPLIGSHDWNDGMNRVGIEGQGESVWLGWFLHATLTRFAPLCERMGDGEQADTYRRQARDLQEALEANAWDGNWYRRAYYDDGTPLGSAENRECQIDSLAQSWAVLSDAGDPARATRAMESVVKRLVRRDDRLLLLFTPPFDETRRDPGYIKGYPPGIRENGGQYTHAALWAVWAFAELGQGDRAGALFRLLNPITHSDTPEKAQHYRVEPYVVAADVYGAAPHTGRGGWTWYTGSSGWMYRLGLETILGLQKVGRLLRVAPCIPKDWPGFTLTYREGETVYQIQVENPERVNRGVRQVTLDGEELPGEEIPLAGDGKEHEVHILMG